MLSIAVASCSIRATSLLYCVCCFFLQADGAHRDLHSFPTRRSSDLAQLVNGRLRPTFRSIWLAGGGVLSAECLRDRKSTRLNSSHRCISYAVFCLKKKNEAARGNASDGGQSANGNEQLDG